MSIKRIFLFGLSFSLLTALPAWAGQGGGGAQRGGQSAPLGQPARGVTQRNQQQLQNKTRLNDRDQIYGSQLMTPAERSSYRTQMRSMKTAREREVLRQQHHQQMQQRATERGMTLPDMPPHSGDGMGPGSGMGPGNGMGPGSGVQQRTQQQINQQQQNQGQDQKIQQKQRTEQQTQTSKDDGNN